MVVFQIIFVSLSADMKYLIAMMLFLLPLVPANGQQRHSDALDDVLQHAPMATVFVLKACELENSSSWTELALTAAASYALSTATAYSLKQFTSERRPDGSDRRSFPSGHATYAFAGATMLHHEFGHLSPWVTIGGYGLATLTALDRLARDRHYLHDVCAGAAIGVAATEVSYLLRRRFIKNDHIDLSFTGYGLELAVKW